MTADGLQPTFVEDPFCTGINSYAQVSNNFFWRYTKTTIPYKLSWKRWGVGKITRPDIRLIVKPAPSTSPVRPITHQSRTNHDVVIRVFPFYLGVFPRSFWYTCHEGSFGDSMKTPPFIIKVLSLTVVFILFGVWRYSKTLWAWDFCRANSWWGRSTNQLSPKEIESEWSNCFKMNLLVIRNLTRRVRFYFILFTSALSWAIPLTCNPWRNRLRIV